MTSFDFHIHSGLSACAEKTMSPRQIVLQAKKAGLNFIAITDHNASANVKPICEASNELGGPVIVPGMEVASAEEAHFLALFKSLEALFDFQELVDSKLPNEQNPVEIFGYQIIYDVSDEVVDTDDRLRQIGTFLTVNEIVSEVKSRGGFIVPSHVFKTKFSLMSQLGFIMSGAGFDAIEIPARQWVAENYKIGMRVEGYPAITGSDAHFLDSIGRIYNQIS
ncbi:MAG: PHP domain-containing protein, partial [Candidatus Nanoarchaeia archaeon]